MKFLFQKSLPIFVITILIACNHGEDNKDKSVFRYNEAAGITSLDPVFARDQANIWVCNQLYNGLVQFDDNLNILPCIAKSWTIFPDKKTYVFTLRNDVYFHDAEFFPFAKGRKVKSSDFVYSFERLRAEETASPGAWVLNHVQKNDSAILAINDTTLYIRLQQPFPPFLSLLCMSYCSVLPKEAVERYGKDFRSHPVGTGPFFLKFWKEGVKMVLLKNPKYFEKENDATLPYLDAVSISFIVDKQTAFFEFIKGNLDFISGLDPGYKDEILRPDGTLNPKYKNDIIMISQPYLNTEYLGFLNDQPSLEPLKDKRIRQAINVGFDRRKMLKFLRNNIGTPGVFGFVPPGMPGFDTTFCKPFDYNPALSRKLLKEAGYPNGTGLPEIKLVTTASYLDLCNFIQHELSEINIKIRIDVTPPASLREMIAQSKVDFFRGSWIADYPDAENYLSLFNSQNFCPKGPNYTHFSNNVFDQLYQNAVAEPNDSLRFRYYRQMDSIFREEVPAIVLYYDQVLRFTRKNIIGLGSNPMNLLVLKRVRKKNDF